MQQNAFDHPDKHLSDQQNLQIVPKEKNQPNPQKGLGDQVSQNACKQNGNGGFLFPDRISQNDQGFYNDCKS
jgi:hypothetical protein